MDLLLLAWQLLLRWGLPDTPTGRLVDLYNYELYGQTTANLRSDAYW
jgi:hypothetical protein